MNNTGLATIIISVTAIAATALVIYESEQKKKYAPVKGSQNPGTTSTLPAGWQIPMALPNNYVPSYGIENILPDFYQIFGGNPLIMY